MNPNQGDAKLIGLLFGACMAGAVCGLLPLIVGIVRKRIGLAIGGFVCTVVAGLILGLLLAIPSSIVWTVIILVVGRGDAAQIELRRRRALDDYEDDYEDDRLDVDRDINFLPRQRQRSEPQSSDQIPDDRIRGVEG